MPGPVGGRMSPRGFLTDDEKKNAPKISWPLIKRIISYLKPYWLQFLLVFLAILVSAGIGLLPSIITSKIVDDALIRYKDITLLIKLLIAAFGTMIASEVIGVLESYINAWIGNRIIFDMRNQMYGHLLSMPHAFFTTEKQGDIITRMNSDISGVSSVISGTLSSIVRNATVVITTLVALFVLSVPLALIGIVVIPLFILPTRSAGKTRWKLASESQEKHDEMNQLVNETLSVSGSLLVKLFTREKREMQHFEKVNDEVTRLSMKEQRSGKWFMVMMGLFTQIGPLLIYLAGGYFLIVREDPTVTVGTITASVALINRLYRPIQSLLNIHVDFTRSLALFTRIFDYFDMVPAIRQPEHARRPVVNRQDIRYEHVAFSYSPDKPLLEDITFTVPSGKMYAIVGPSGSGKSTIVNLLPRLYDVNGGSVKIGDTDVRDFDILYLRKCIGVVTQDSYLFNGTIRDNLLYAKETATDADLMAALKTASLAEFIENQPDGLDTVVGNRGLKLSGGEKQRLSLARIILKNPRILILDEATSALDSISENAIQDALERLMEGRTTIVIAHRLSTILKADRILVVANGTITEQGTHDELLAKNGIYRELYETQFRKVIEHEAEKTE
jgi:ATP-binding cassette subfamily B protein